MTDPHSLVQLLLGGGVSGLAFLFRRALAEHDAALKAYADHIADLRERTARTESASSELKDSLRNMRHDMKEIKHAVEGLANYLMHHREGR